MSTLRVVKPATGEKLSLPRTTDQVVAIGFDTGSANVERAGNDLVFQFDDGAEARITNFFVTNGKPLPNFVLEDGTEISSADILKQLNESMDLKTAAGPGGSSAGSGGVGEYADDPGALIAGVSRLGSLGTDYWGRDTEVSEYYTTDASAPDIQSAFVPEISIRPLPPGEWPNIPGFPGGPNGPGYSVSAAGDAILFYEAYLNGGTVAGSTGTSLTAYLIYEIISNDGLANVTIGGTAYAVAVDNSVSGVVGYQFASDADGGCGSVSNAFVMEGAAPGTYYLAIEYTLDHAHEHPFAVENPQSEPLGDLGVSVGSVNGASSGTASGTISVHDDAPIASDETLTIAETNYASTSINILANDQYGADGQAASGALVYGEVTFDGTALTVALDGSLTDGSGNSYGKLVLGADGNVTYTRPGNIELSGTLTVGYTLKDADGDIDTATLTITVEENRIVPSIVSTASESSLTVHEDGLAGIGTNAGSAGHPTTATGVVKVESIQELANVEIGGLTLTITGVAVNGIVPYTATGAETVPHGAFSVTGVTFDAATSVYTVSYSYTLTEATQAHADNSQATGTHEELPSAIAIAFKATDITNDSVDGVIDLQIHDDAPILSLTTETASVDGYIHLGNTYMTTGTLTPEYGADLSFGTGDDYVIVSYEGQRSVMVGGSPVTETITDTKTATFDADGKATVYTGLGVIEFTRQVDGTITYKYLAKHGLKSDYEEVAFTIMDGDKDTASQSMKVMMDHDVPAGTSYVDEAGIVGIGSHHPGYEAAAYSFDVILPEGTTTFEWDLASINGDSANAIPADAGGDGQFSSVTWSVDANGNLIATAEGETILTISSPKLDGGGNVILTQDGGGNWVAQLEVTLHSPIQHTAPPVVTDSGYNVLGLYLGFEATSPDGSGGTQITSNAVSVAIIDDAPSAREMTLEVVEAVKAPEDVYLIMDVSTSISAADLKKGMQALRVLVQKYEAEGIEATFTLVTFGYEAKEWGTHLSATDMLAVLNAGLTGSDSAIADYWRSGVGTNTNYDSALDLVQHLITAAQQEGSLRYYDQKVYFISDGAPNAGIDMGFSSWNAFIQEHGASAGNEQVEVYAVGVGSALSSNSNWSTLMGVTNDGSDHGIKVNNYADLADKLTALIAPGKATGNLFGADTDNNDVQSADLTTVVSVEVNGSAYMVQASGETVDITIDTGVTLKVYANGDYTITSTQSVDSDHTYDLKYTIKDADGDTSTADLQLVLKDAKPDAFDNVAGEAVTYTKNVPIVLENFGTNSGWLSANTNTLYNQKLNGGSYTDINGNTSTLTGNNSHNFVKIMPDYNSTTSVSFDKALSYVTGQAVANTFNTTDSPRSGSYIEKSFDLLAVGTVKFNYVFTHGTGGTVSTQEKAFWILLDENGDVYKAGLITSGNATSSGLISIPVENAGQYTLVLGCYDMSASNSMPTLYVDQVVYMPADSSDIYHGNVIEDDSPLGMADNLADHAVLYMVRFTGMDGNVHEYTVGEGAFATGLLVLEGVFAAGDKLTINDNGNYVYQAEAGSSVDNVNIEYFIKEPGSNDIDSAMLYIRSGEYRHEGADLDQRGESGSHVIVGTDGTDLIYAGDGGDILYGGAGDDIIHGGAGGDVIHTGDGNNTVHGGAGDDIIHGGAGNDVIHGGAGNDIIYGGAGNDIIYGGAGDDTMYGGAGSDIFAWASGDYGGIDTIMDFTLREDRLSFEGLFGSSQNNIAMKDILAALEDGRIDLTAMDATKLAITVSAPSGSVQTVQIFLEDSSLTASQVAAFQDSHEMNPASDAEKAALLQQMLTSITG